MTQRRPGAVVWLVLALTVWATLWAAGPATAQSFATADLAGTWRVFHLATPTSGVTGASIRSYSGAVTFDGTGAVSAGTLTDDQFTGYTVTGALTLSPAGLLQGTLTLDGGLGTIVVHEARALPSKFTIVGAATVLGQVGLFTFVKPGGQTFSLNGDVANEGDGTGNYAYHEITPSNDLVGGDASWTAGSITFHENNGCTEADLVLADGTIRAQRAQGEFSFL